MLEESVIQRVLGTAHLLEHFENRGFHRWIGFQIDAFESSQSFQGDSGVLGIGLPVRLRFDLDDWQ